MPKTITLAIPDEIADTPVEPVYVQAMQQVINEQTVLRLYRDHKISTGRGARLLGMSIYDFIQFLSCHQVSIFNYEEGELEADANAARMGATAQPERRLA